jgi:hypothetical protein
MLLPQVPFIEDAHGLSVKQAMDRALAELAAEDAAPHDEQQAVSANFNLTVALREFPRPVPRYGVNMVHECCKYAVRPWCRISGYDVFSANGGQWLFVVPMVTFFSVLVDLVYEKEYRLRVRWCG